MLREGSLPGVQALRGKGGPRRQPTLSCFSCPRMYADTASQIATTSGKQRKEVSGSGPASSQPLGKLLAQGLTEAGVRKQPRQTRPRLRSWAVPQFPTASRTLLPGQGWGTNGDVGRAQDRGCGHLTPRKPWHPRAQDVICQPGGTRGSHGEDERFSQRRLCSRERADLQHRHFQPARESPVGAVAVPPSPRDAEALFIPEPEPHEGPASFQGKLAPDGPPRKGTEPFPWEPQGSGQQQHLLATSSPESSGTPRQGSRSSPQPCPVTPTAWQLQLFPEASPGATPREGIPKPLTLGGEMQERGEQAAELQADGHGAAALHRACRLSSAQGKGCSSQLLAQNSSPTCPCCSAGHNGSPQRSPAASRSRSWLWSSSEGQQWGAPEQCPAAPKPRREVPAALGRPPWDAGHPPVTSARIV